MNTSSPLRRPLRNAGWPPRVILVVLVLDGPGRIEEEIEDDDGDEDEPDLGESDP